MDVTAVTTFYNTPELKGASIDPLKRFYPNMPIVIWDNSDTIEYAGLLKRLCAHDRNIFVYQSQYNMGHGPGLNRGMNHVLTKYAFIFDSDWKTEKTGLIEAMKKVLDDDSYGVGFVMKTSRAGHNSSASDAIDYLHPRACLINVSKYLNNPIFVSGGAPFAVTMSALHDKRIRVINFPITDYGIHLSGATRIKYGIPSKYVGE